MSAALQSLTARRLSVCSPRACRLTTCRAGAGSRPVGSHSPTDECSTYGRHLPAGRHVDTVPDGRHVDIVPDGRHADMVPDGRHADTVPAGRHVDIVPDGRHGRFISQFLSVIHPSTSIPDTKQLGM